MVKAKKEFGQNFLQDPTVLTKIIEAMSETERPLLEIGPGLGDLTQELLSRRQVVAVEIDRDLTKILKEKFAHNLASGRLRLIEEDVLTRWEKGPLIECEYDLVANLPYYVATPIIMRALRDDRCRELIVMVQKEVGEKLAATAGAREFGALSILAQCNADVQLLFDVPPKSFDPAPKVMSAVVKLSKLPVRREEIGVEFEHFLHKAFQAPRKTIANNLASYDKETLWNALEMIGATPTSRPHQLSADNFIALYRALSGRA